MCVYVCVCVCVCVCVSVYGSVARTSSWLRRTGSHGVDWRNANTISSSASAGRACSTNSLKQKQQQQQVMMLPYYPLIAKHLCSLCNVCALSLSRPLRTISVYTQCCYSLHEEHIRKRAVWRLDVCVKVHLRRESPRRQQNKQKAIPNTQTDTSTHRRTHAHRQTDRQTDRHTHTHTHTHTQRLREIMHVHGKGKRKGAKTSHPQLHNSILVQTKWQGGRPPCKQT